MSNKIKVGVFVTDRKISKPDWKAFLTSCSHSEKIELKEIKPSLPIETQGPFDVIVTKLTDVFSKEDEINKTIVQNFERFVKSHPEVLLLDSLEAQRTTTNRSTIYSVLQKKNPILFTSPNEDTVSTIFDCESQ